MAIRIGAAYDAKRGDLAERIRTGELSVLEAEAEAHACYFCARKITGTMVVLIDENTDSQHPLTSQYFLDPACYRKAQSHTWFGTLRLPSN
ncbi:MAG TPA: hypothetical protein VJB08_04710 [Candidatus Nanoarchaeia archaeon]|nr:hypothetical protein [Candidatus Nanoarchaeia archaeon]